MVGEMFLDLADCGTTWSNPQTSSTNLVVIDEPDPESGYDPRHHNVEAGSFLHQDMSPSFASRLLTSSTLNHFSRHI